MFEHEVALQEIGIEKSQLPASIKNKINVFHREQKKIFADPNNIDKQKEIDLHVFSIRIADEIQDFKDQEYPDNIEENPNPNNMTKEQEALQARAKACGLPETATETEVAAKEKEIADQAAADKTAADKAASDKEISDKAAANKAAADKAGTDKAAADKAAADKVIADKAAADKAKPKVEQDFFDDFDI